MGEPTNIKPCPHIHKSIDLSHLENSIIKSEFHDNCTECMGCRPRKNDGDSTLWMCLKCGNQACGKTWNKHALSHYQTPAFVLHCLCVNTTTWKVWCYKCTHWVNVNSNQGLLKTVQYLQKLANVIRKRNEFIYFDNVCVPQSQMPSVSSEQMMHSAYPDICYCGKANYLIYNATRTKKLALNHAMKMAKIMEIVSKEFGIKPTKMVEESSGVIQYLLKRSVNDPLIFNSEKGGVYMILEEHEVWEERGDIAELKVADRFRDGYKFCDFRRKKKCFVGKESLEQRRLNVQELINLGSKILRIQGVELVREADGATLLGDVEYKDVIMILERAQKWLPEDY